jgi:hypothetical protein
MKKALIFLFLFFSGAPAFADDAFAPNYNLMTSRLSTDIKNFGASLEENFEPSGQLVKDFVPIEAKIGAFFMSALSSVSRAVYAIFIPFLNAFIIALFAFWIFMESWQMIKKDNDYWNLAERIVKKGALIVIWLWILNNDPAELFMWIASPIITLGSGMSDLVFSSTAKMVGTNLPDTCAAIHSWMDANDTLLISGPYAADFLCMPVRAAGLFYTNVAVGLRWMSQGLGGPGLGFITGLIFVLLFIYNIWKFAIAALGVVIDLFFVLMFLPFTALKECFDGKDVKYDGVFKPVFEQFVNFVNGAKLSAQFMKFINAIIYFIALSVVSAICVALMSGAQNDFISILICGCIAVYLLEQTDALAGKLGGKIDTGFGKSLEDLVGNIGKNIAKWGKGAASIITKGKAPAAGGGTAAPNP